jgi:hypothetical protein
MDKLIKVGDAVIYIDERYREHNALVTSVHGEPDKRPCVNLLFVSDDESRRDQYGTQIDRRSSCVHRVNNSARANCWHFAGEAHHAE